VTAPLRVHPAVVLLVEDSPGDVALTKRALQKANASAELHVVNDGDEALAFLFRRPPFAAAPRPDLILLDLNLPKVDGRAVLAEIKADPAVRSIPVVVLTTSTAEQDVARSYELHANAYIAKPVDFGNFLEIVRVLLAFWLDVVRRPAS
jgi:chemotaxis family two-component system response regulator Rcp1